MRKSGKRPLTECLSENNGPTENKRSRPTDTGTVVNQPPHPHPPTNRHRRRRRARQSVQNQYNQSEQRLEAGQGRKRHINSSTSSISEESTIEVDENDITELSLRLKKARLRPPVFFTISSFIEQTVDDVSITVGDEDQNNGDSTNTTSTFTFVLPLPTITPTFGGYEYRHSFNCDHASVDEEET